TETHTRPTLTSRHPLCSLRFLCPRCGWQVDLRTISGDPRDELAALHTTANGVDDERDRVTTFQRARFPAGANQMLGARHFDTPFRRRRTRLAIGHQLNKDMGVRPEKLLDHAVQRDGFLGVENREGVMCGGGVEKHREANAHDNSLARSRASAQRSLNHRPAPPRARTSYSDP